ncbi:AraC-type DNA-binding protein [Raineyella antarctica]|uniref:AraC-type DNA-binding protein n=1 Tax=Raineyella antarctica TaxID=1577474 RepID=A0A1G6ID26_9ACTN|nr:helix-turn-helix domain-containing protein [Raineyella antarctica]SDC04439.1 AraC-type DNA-binding protein [Raineyella antarctica]
MARSILAPDLWREAMGETFYGLEPAAAHPSTGEPPTGRVRAIALDDVGVYSIAGNEQALTRSPRAVRHHPSDILKVCLVVHGAATLEQSGNVVSVLPGEFALYDTERPYRLTQHGTWDVRVMTVHRSALDLHDRQVRRLLERPHPADSGAGVLYASYLAGVVDGADPDAAAISRHLRDAGISLLRAALTRDLDPVLEARADVVAEQVLAFVRANLADEGLSLEKVAHSQNLSTRTVQRLLAQQGVTFTTLLRTSRLEAIRRDLADPALRHLPIGTLAAHAGVHDQAWLSRTFRKAYGTSPSDFRREHALTQ